MDAENNMNIKKSELDNFAELAFDELTDKIRVTEENIKRLEKEIEEYVTDLRYIKLIKFAVLIIPLVIFGYLIYNNFIVSQDFTYFYDIGSEKDNYLSPATRISDKIIEEDVNYRNMTGHLVYFNVPIPRGAETIKVQAKFKDNFPKNTKLRFGAKDQEVWHYVYKEVFNSNNNSNEKEWIISEEISFDIEENNLYLIDGKLSMFLNMEHLNPSRNETNTEYIPVDWIEIKVHKPGAFEK